MGCKVIFIHPPHTLPPADGEDKHSIVFLCEVPFSTSSPAMGDKESRCVPCLFKLLLFF